MSRNGDGLTTFLHRGLKVGGCGGIHLNRSASRGTTEEIKNRRFSVTFEVTVTTPP